MFKKLKDKIAEEVKQSPLKSVQQLAQAVVSPSSSSVFEPSSSNDKFCIEEADIEEEEKQEPVKAGGFTSVTLIGQTTSPIRDEKFGSRSSVLFPDSKAGKRLSTSEDNLFPVFEPQSTNFHVQSDWESASEVEDRYSQLEHINKESLYEAYRKVYNKYTKVKNKHQELIAHYRQLEKEKEKAKTVLTETQDKTLRRISELKDQCLLEQQAKAHLEEALRNELEERDHIINALKTKVQYLKSINDCSISENLEGTSLSITESENLIDFTENTSVSKVPSPSTASVSTVNTGSIDWFEDRLVKCKQLLVEETEKIESLKSKLEVMEKKTSDTEKIDSDIIVNDEIHKELNQSILNLINTLSKDVLNIQKTASSFFQSKMFKDEVNNLSNMEASYEEQSLLEPKTRKFENDALKDKGDGTNIVPPTINLIKDIQDPNPFNFDELIRQNKILNQRLEEENNKAQKMQTEIKKLNELFDTVKAQLKTTNEQISKQIITSNDQFVLQSDNNELVRELNCCLIYLFNKTVEVKQLEEIKEKLENEIKNIKAEMDMASNKYQNLKTENENCNKKFMETNEKLKNALEDFQIANSRLNEIAILSTEISNLKKINEELKTNIITLEKSLSDCKKESYATQQALHEVNKNVDEDRCLLQNKILNLEHDLENTKANYLLALDEKEKISNEMSLIKQENIKICSEKNDLSNKFNELESNLKQCMEECKIMLDIKLELQNKISSLNKENEILCLEKSAIENKLCDLEIQLNTTKENYKRSIEIQQDLSNKLLFLTEKQNNYVSEYDASQIKVESLKKDLENKKKEFLGLCELNKSLSEELEEVKRERNTLAIEKDTMYTNMKKLEEDFDKSKDSNDELNLKHCEDISLLKKEQEIVAMEKESIENKFCKAESDLEACNKKLSLLSESNFKLSEEVTSLSKQRHDWSLEKINFHSKIEMLDEALKKREEELSLLTESKYLISQEFSLLKEEQNNLKKEISIHQSKNKQLQEDLNGNINELSSVYEKNRKLTNDIQTLQKELEVTAVEKQALQDNVNNLLNQMEEHKTALLSMSEAKNKLSDELVSITKEYYDSLDILNTMKNHLEKEKETCSQLDRQVLLLSESLKTKSIDMDEKYQENTRLKTDIENMLNKLNHQSGLLENLTKEKNCLLNHLLATLDLVRNVKKLQENIFDVFLHFREEIKSELNNINRKVETDFFSKLNVLLQNQKTESQSIDVDCRSKKDIDSYNSKIKYLQTENQNSEEIPKIHTTLQESGVPSKNKLQNPILEQFNVEDIPNFETLENGQKPAESFEYYYNKCGELQKHLNIALSIMKSFTKPFNNNLEDSKIEVNDMLISSNGSNCSELLDDDYKITRKQILAMESFITEFEELYKNVGDPGGSLNNAETIKHACEENASIENKLRQELNLKDDIIKKLQFVVEGHELGTIDSLLIKKLNFNDSSEDEKLLLLQKQNQDLLLQLEKNKETHETNLKNTILNYEKKIKELEEEKGFHGFAKSGKETNYIVNEMKEQIENLQQDLDERGDAFEKLYEEHQHSTKIRDEEIAELRNCYEKEMRDQDKKWRSCLDRRVAEEEARHQEELTLLSRQWNSERKELETAKRLAVNAVESGSSSSDLLRRQVQALTMQLTELRNHRCETCDHLRTGEHMLTHPSSNQYCTEMEYLRNILYEYMMGKEPLVLAKVLCAVLKFDENQTRDVVLKEEQKVTLFGQLGIL